MLNDIRLVVWIIGAIALLALLWDGLKRHHDSRQSLEKRKAQAEHDQPLDSAEAPHSDESLAQEVPEPDVIEIKEELVQEEENKSTCANEEILPEPREIEITDVVEELSTENIPGNIEADATAQTEVEPILFTLKASEKHPFSGFRLLHTILKLGFHFNAEKHWFDYHLNQDKQQPVLFSLVAATKTGLFDIANMANFSCKGLIVFFETDLASETLKSFEEMINVSEALANELMAEIYINHDQPWDDANLEKIRLTLKN